MAMVGELASTGEGAPPRSLHRPLGTTPSHIRSERWSRWLDPLLAHLVVALVALVGIGGATRVMQAGLACPDWPLCYGSLLPGGQMNLQVFLEWFHRLDAFLVGLALIAVLGLALGPARGRWPWLPWMASLCLALVVAQGALGALTVVGLLAAGTVTAHLVTALVLVAVVSATHQALIAGPSLPLAEAIGHPVCAKTITRANGTPAPSAAVIPSRLPGWWLVLLALASLTVLLQCALGGAMASRWAASLCLEAGEGCQWLLRHRFGAWPAASALGLLAFTSLALPSAAHAVRRMAWLPALLVAVQLPLGVLILRLQLSQPLITVTHQLLAALLVALLGALWGRSLAARTPLLTAPSPPSPYVPGLRFPAAPLRPPPPCSPPLFSCSPPTPPPPPRPPPARGPLPSVRARPLWPAAPPRHRHPRCPHWPPSSRWRHAGPSAEGT